MKTRLQEHFGNRIVQTEINGKPYVITFRTTARVVLQDYYSKQQQQKQNTAEEKMIETCTGCCKAYQGRYQSHRNIS